MLMSSCCSVSGPWTPQQKQQFVPGSHALRRLGALLALSSLTVSSVSDPEPEIEDALADEADCAGPAALQWIPVGTQFKFEDMVTWAGKSPGQRFEEVAARIDTIIVGPHASAALPEELRPFISPNLTHRKQFDFSDVSTSHVGRAWAELDPRVVFVENPHARVVLDPNRARGEDPELHLREFYARLDQLRHGELGVSFAGLDAVRPVTFSLEDVLVEPDESNPPEHPGSWSSLVEALKSSALLGPLAYERALERVVALIVEARRGKPVSFIGLHDTSNFKMRPDGAIVVERPEADRLPRIVNFGNLGDFIGDGPSVANTSLASGEMLRRTAEAWAQAFGVRPQGFTYPAQYAFQEDVSFNRPYAGGHEVRSWARRLFQNDDTNVVAFQVEFERDILLGPLASNALRQPGTSWPAVDHEHVHSVALKLRAAGDGLRAELS